jgi:Fe-S oxidoreductase
MCVTCHRCVRASETLLDSGQDRSNSLRKYATPVSKGMEYLQRGTGRGEGKGLRK